MTESFTRDFEEILFSEDNISFKESLFEKLKENNFKEFQMMIKKHPSLANIYMMNGMIPIQFSLYEDKFEFFKFLLDYSNFSSVVKRNFENNKLLIGRNVLEISILLNKKNYMESICLHPNFKPKYLFRFFASIVNKQQIDLFQLIIDSQVALSLLPIPPTFILLSKHGYTFFLPFYFFFFSLFFFSFFFYLFFLSFLKGWNEGFKKFLEKCKSRRFCFEKGNECFKHASGYYKKKKCIKKNIMKKKIIKKKKFFFT